jgi:lysophospholipase L1-like esterase
MSAADLLPLAPACHDPSTVRARSLLAFFTVIAGCGEGMAAPVKGPPPEVATAPRVERGGSPALQALVDVSEDATGTADAMPVPSTAPAPTSTFPPVGHLEGPNHLAHLYGALARLDDGHGHDDVRIVQYGDSHTASDLGTGTFRHLLQARFGDGGRGFVSVGKPWKTYSQDGIRGGMTKEFETEKIKFRDGHFLGDGCYGLLGIGIGAVSAGARAWTEVTPRFSRVEFAYWQEPHGGSFDVFVDGTKAGRIATRTAQPTSGFFSFDLPDAPHEVEIRTIGDGDVRVFGMTLDRPEAGVVVDSLGINGAQIFTLLRQNEEHFAEQLRHRATDLVILAYGTNEALEPGLTDADYERRLVELLGRVARAAPSASCLLLGPPDLARHTKGKDDWKPWPRVLEIASVQRRVAEAAGCAFYDQMRAMGGPGSIMAWAEEPEPRAGHDRIHLTRSGYAEVATSFATDLMRGYDEWRAEKGLVPTSAVVTWAQRAH